MKNKIIVAFAILLTLGLINSVQTRTAPAAARYQWEYKIDRLCTPTTANELGNQGWEMISYHENDPGVIATPALCVFKREK